MKNVNSVSESPQIIHPPDPEFEFTDHYKNRKLASAIISSSKTVHLTNIDRYSLYKSGYKFVLIDRVGPEIYYYLKYRREFVSLIQKTVISEVLHWRSKKLFPFLNLTSDIFFEYILPLEGIIMTDIKHTKPGERFWIRKIDEAYDRGLNVYYMNLLPTNQANREFLHLHSKEDFREILINIYHDRYPWGETNMYQARKLLISLNKISV